MKEEELTHLRGLRQASPKAETAYHLVETFLHMVRERTGEQLEAWLEAFASLVVSIQQDKDAVLAGLTLPWSTGPRDRHINRLKLIKREPGTVARSSICSGFACSTIPQREKWLKMQRQEPIISDGGIVPRS